MAELNRKPILDRVAALVVGPFLLGRRVLNLEWIDAKASPPGPQTEATTGIAITSPEHAIKRRG
ncbi:MAG TPA: hypothetical protein VF378_13850 [Geothrix sp.]